MKNKNMTYAQVADKLTKKIGELEEKAKSSDRFARETAAQMLPRYKQKLDALFAEQERVKQEEFSQDLQNFQMKWGGKIPQYGIGGDIAAGAVGLIGGALGTVPLVGDIAQNALYGLHGKLDKDLTDQEKSIRGYGQAAGALGAGAITGNFMGAIPDAMEGVQSGYQYGMAYGGRLPKMQPGGMVGDPPYSVDNPPTYEEWLTTRPDMQNDPMSVDYYKMDIANPDKMAKFNPTNIYRGNMGIQTDEYGNQYVQDYTPPMDESYGQAQTPISPKTTAGNPNYQPVQSDNYKDFTGTGELNPETGRYERPGDPNAGGKTYDAPWNAKSEPEQPGYEPEPLKPWQEALYRGAAYAPTIYNTIQGLRKPQVLNHEDFQNPYEQKAMDLMAGRRYNIDPQLQANRSTLNNMKRSLAGAAGGNAGTYLSNLGNLQMNTDRMNEAAYAMKQNMDNQYKAEEAGMLGNLGANRAQTKFTIQDINDRNRAIKAAHLAKATEGLSNIAQNEKYMSNLSDADKARIMALQAMPWDFMPQFNQQNQMTGFEYYNPANQ